ncbi:MAG: hypothetical protein EOO20_03030 [Chryseobacterium sp.]|nr:MAG: hypothetical protein EOO20_03030 [Chryseobacterium sp.]
MSKQTIDILPESKKSDNIFDQYYALIERYKLTEENKKKYDSLVKSLEIVERDLIDLHELGPIHRSEAKRLDTFAKVVLESWYEIFIFFKEDEIFVEAFAYNLLALGMAVQDLHQATNKNLDLLSGFFMPGIDYDPHDFDNANNSLRPNFITYSEYVKILPGQTVTFPVDKYSHINEPTKKVNYKIIHRLQNTFLGMTSEELCSLEVEDVREYMRRMNLMQLIFDYQIKLTETADVSWSLTIKTSENRPDARKFLGLISDLMSYIGLISEDIDIELDDWGSGSKWARFTLRIKSYFDREDVKEVLLKGVQAAQAQYLDKPINEADKLKAEADMIKKQSEVVMDADQARHANELELQLKELDVVERTLDIEAKAIENKLKKIELHKKISDLIKDRLLEVDSPLTLEINGLTAFKCPPINKIDINYDQTANRESVQPKIENSDPESK